MIVFLVVAFFSRGGIAGIADYDSREKACVAAFVQQQNDKLKRTVKVTKAFVDNDGAIKWVKDIDCPSWKRID